MSGGRPKAWVNTFQALALHSVKAPAAEARGYGAGKIKGRKRHIAVDTDGRTLMINLDASNNSVFWGR
jgi:hypothetical protein